KTRTKSSRFAQKLTAFGQASGLFGDCSKDTGLIQPVHDEVMPGFVDGLQRGLHATYPAQDAHGFALACGRDRRCLARCDSADCRVPPHWTSRVAAYHGEMSALFLTWGQRASLACHQGL